MAGDDEDVRVAARGQQNGVDHTTTVSDGAEVAYLDERTTLLLRIDGQQGDKDTRTVGQHVHGDAEPDAATAHDESGQDDLQHEETGTARQPVTRSRGSR